MVTAVSSTVDQNGDASRPLLDAGSASASGVPQYQTLDGRQQPASPESAGRPSDPGSFGSIGSGDQQRPSLDRQQSRQSFQANRRESVQSAVLHRDSVLSFASMLVYLLLLMPIVFLIYIEVKSWYVLLRYSNLPCDQNLVNWLLVRNLFTLILPRMPPSESTPEQRARYRLGTIISALWLVLGYFWSSRSKTCIETNPSVYSWVRFLTIFGLMVHVLAFLLPRLILLVVELYHTAVARGWIKSPNAASDDAIERLEKVAYNKELFSGEPNAAAPEEEPPPRECCCCMEEFGTDKDIVCTPCKHYFHHECLKEWLKLAKTCPLCRRDLDVDPRV